MNEEEKIWLGEWLSECEDIRETILGTDFGKDPSTYPVVFLKAIRPFHFFLEEKLLAKAHADYQASTAPSGTPPGAVTGNSGGAATATTATTNGLSEKVRVTISGPKLAQDKEGREYLKKMGFHFNGAPKNDWTGTIARAQVKEISEFRAKRGLVVAFEAVAP